MTVYCVTVYLDVEAASETDARDIVNAILTGEQPHPGVRYVDVATDVNEAESYDDEEDDR